MEDINIAEILKDKPKGTKLYSTVFGAVILNNVTKKHIIETIENSTSFTPQLFHKDGRYIKGRGEPLLFPSNEMRDWTKFAWKKGDVLTDKDANFKCIFDSWANEHYTKVNIKHCLNNLGDYVQKTKEFTKILNKASDFDAEKYIKGIEEMLGGKLDCGTLEVENPTCTFKVFEKVLVRDNDNSGWLPKFFGRLNVFENKKEYPYMTTEGYAYAQCIPYKGNEHLAFTNKSV